MNAADKDTINLYRNLNDRIQELEAAMRTLIFNADVQGAIIDAGRRDLYEFARDTLSGKLSGNQAASKMTLANAMAISSGRVSV